MFPFGTKAKCIIARTQRNDNFSQLVDLTKQLGRNVKDGTAIHEVERDIQPRLLGIGQEALGAFIAKQGNGDLGETLELEGRPLNRLGYIHKRTYRSFFGTFILDRAIVWMAQRASRQNPKGQKPVVFLADGRRLLSTGLERHPDLEQQDIVEILDLNPRHTPVVECGACVLWREQR